MLNVFTDFLKRLSTGLRFALQIAKERGLTDEILAIALRLVKLAADRFVDNAEKREWVVKTLVARGISESTARISVELAVQLYKRERSAIVWSD